MRHSTFRAGDVYVTRVTWSRILALYVTLAFLLTCDAFGTFIEASAESTMPGGTAPCVVGELKP